MAPEAEILVVGALHLDVVVNAPNLPAVDETVVGDAVAYRFGGKGGNQAVAAARLGANVAMAGRVGSDQFGKQILETLDDAKVDRAQVLTVPGASGMSVAIIDQSGDYGAVIVSGVNRTIDGEAVAFPPGVKAVLLQNEVPENVNIAIARRLPRETLLILNAAPARPLAKELLERVDVLVVNRIEAHTLAGTSDPARAAWTLLNAGPKIVIVTLGANGLVYAARDTEPTALPAQPVHVISSHGAGDAFTGALAVELACGASVQDALTFAQATAALVVSTHPDERDKITGDDVRTKL